MVLYKRCAQQVHSEQYVPLEATWHLRLHHRIALPHLAKQTYLFSALHRNPPQPPKGETNGSCHTCDVSFGSAQIQRPAPCGGLSYLKEYTSLHPPPLQLPHPFAITRKCRETNWHTTNAHGQTGIARDALPKQHLSLKTCPYLTLSTIVITEQGMRTQCAAFSASSGGFYCSSGTSGAVE